MSKARAPRPSNHEPQTPAPRAEPARFLDPFDNRALLGYLYTVTQWHGYLRFLGLPQLRENPDQPLQELFVEPYVSRAPVHSDRPSTEWQEGIQSALQAVLENSRLVLLGDPGSGKSTLVSFIAGQFSQPRSSLWQATLGQLIPLPMVLRELKLDKELTAESLIEAFLAHPVAEKLRSARGVLASLFELGQAYFLLDGLDEIGNVEVRRALRSAVFELAEQFPRCRFLLTSRVVGYEEVAYRWVHFDQGTTPSHKGLVPRLGRAWAEVRYVTPFSDEQIEQFARNWYARREVAEELRKTGAQDLVEAVHGSESTLRLARTPNLLTLMALIHRVHRRLPYGRVLLFDKISEAYLESIDVFRGIQEIDYPLAQKRRWLAYVGFQMQYRRSEAARKGDSELREQREVLVAQETVQSWVIEAMAASAHGVDPEAARSFLDYVGRRSGLLLPRGEGLFAFTHLSFQEYFAACYLAEQVNSPHWLNGKAVRGAGPDEIFNYSNQVEWRETLILLFELLADRPAWLEVLFASVFGERFEKVEPDGLSQAERVQLLAELVMDPYSGLTQQRQSAALRKSWEWEILRQQKVGKEFWTLSPVVAQRLTKVEQSNCQDVWRCFEDVAREISPALLSLKGCSGLNERGILSLSTCARLKFLDLAETDVVDLAPLAQLEDLLMIDLRDTKIADLYPLENSVNLISIGLGGTYVSDLSHLASLIKLKAISFDRTQVADLTPLAFLCDLEYLQLFDTDVVDLSPLSGLAVLEGLDVSGTSITDLTPLAPLANMKSLRLGRTPVTDLSPLEHLRDLKELHLDETGVTDLSPLANLAQLQEVDLSWTAIHSLKVVATWKSLRKLWLWGTSVPDREIEALRRTFPKLVVELGP